jgi:hypothetical protein
VTYRAVLDASAAIAYTHASVDLGEVLGEIADEPGVLVAIPVAALVAAARAGADPQLLGALAEPPNVHVLPLEPGRWEHVASAAALLGSLDRGCAGLLSIDGEAELVLTRDPDVYGEGIPTVAV